MVLLNFNECPYGPSAAQQAARDSIASCGRYRFALAAQVRDAFIKQARIPADHVRLYPGSSEPLNPPPWWTGPQAGLVVADPTFETLGEVAAAHGAHVRKCRCATRAHDLRAIAAAARPTGLLCVQSEQPDRFDQPTG